MDHQLAIETNAVERYLLGELPDADAGKFELHFFECAECAAAVEAGQQFVANARAVMAQTDAPPARAPSRNFFTRLLATDLLATWMRPASIGPAVIGALAMYVLAVAVPNMRQGVTIEAVPGFVLNGAVRGDGAPIMVPAKAARFSVMLDIPPEAHFAGYLCELSSAGRNLGRASCPAPPPGQPVEVSLSTKGLIPGRYTLTIFGARADGSEAGKVTSSTFELKFTT